MSKNTRNRILLTAVAALMLVVVAVGGTIAYLIDQTDPITNTFTPSSVNVNLDETVPTNKTAQMVPGVEIPKDPTVSVAANTLTVPYYVYVVVTETNSPSTYMDYSIDSAWTPLTGYTGVYYIEVDENYTAAQSWEVLTDSKVTVKTSVTDEQLEAMTSTDKYPTMTFQAYVAQMAPANDPVVSWETYLGMASN